MSLREIPRELIPDVLSIASDRLTQEHDPAWCERVAAAVADRLGCRVVIDGGETALEGDQALYAGQIRPVPEEIDAVIGEEWDRLVQEWDWYCSHQTLATELVLCVSADGWSLHAPGSTDDEIASGDAPYLACGSGEPTDDDYARALRALRGEEVPRG